MARDRDIPDRYAAITGSGGSSTYVLNDMWAANKGTTQTLSVWNPGHWSVFANARPVGYTGVQTHGYLAAGSGLNQIDYGFEICSTRGPQTFTVSRFAINST